MTDNICAISTALGVGAISIIRISGPDAIKIANSIFQGPNLEDATSHTIHHGFIVDKNENIDEVLISVMRSPKTFTTENIVEINCHGGIATTNKILELLLTKGIRLAEPGEFTKRAFLNGRIDLIEAESISDLIYSKTDNARKLAMSGVEGRLGSVIKEARSSILEIMANIEVNIDYPEYEDAIEVTNELLKTKLNEITINLNNLLETSKNGKLIKEGIKVALIGRPNVGKSSILNAFLDEERAIVTDIAGTTRDTVEGNISLNGILLNIIDTAGIRETEDIIESIGVEKSNKVMNDADLIIYILANNEKIMDSDIEIIEKITPEKLIIFINKDDEKLNGNFDVLDNYNVIFGNTKELNGLDRLKERIIEKFNLSEISSGDFTYLSNARQIGLVRNALKHIKDAKEQAEKNIPVDMIAIDIRSCWDILGEIIGETYKDELLDELFNKFCLGK